MLHPLPLLLRFLPSASSAMMPSTSMFSAFDALKLHEHQNTISTHTAHLYSLTSQTTAKSEQPMTNGGNMSSPPPFSTTKTAVLAILFVMIVCQFPCKTMALPLQTNGIGVDNVAALNKFQSDDDQFSAFDTGQTLIDSEQQMPHPGTLFRSKREIQETSGKRPRNSNNSNRKRKVNNGNKRQKGDKNRRYYNYDAFDDEIIDEKHWDADNEKDDDEDDSDDDNSEEEEQKRIKNQRKFKRYRKQANNNNNNAVKKHVHEHIHHHHEQPIKGNGRGSSRSNGGGIISNSSGSSNNNNNAGSGKNKHWKMLAGAVAALGVGHISGRAVAQAQQPFIPQPFLGGPVIPPPFVPPPIIPQPIFPNPFLNPIGPFPIGVF